MEEIGKIRLLILDDRPSLRDPGTQCVSFLARSGVGDEKIYERNFSLKWIYDVCQAKEFYYRIGLSIAKAPLELTTVAPYPNILLIDYQFDKSADSERALETQVGALDFYRRHQDPLQGDWGRHFELLGLDEAAFDAQMTRKARAGDNLDGCFAGGLISRQLCDFGCVGVPQTVHATSPLTDCFEWMLDIDLKGAVAIKQGLLRHWFEFFEKSLPRLRQQLIDGAVKGSMTPDIWAILDLATAADPAALQEKTVAFNSRLGHEVFRVEALFFDTIYGSDDAGELHPAEDGRMAAAVADWSARLLDAAAGRGKINDLRKGLDVAELFAAAYADPRHTQRRIISRDLASVLGKDKLRIDHVVAVHDVALGELGVDVGALTDVLAEKDNKKLKTIELSPAGMEAFGVLDGLKAEAGSAAAARAAALALMVWAEMICAGEVAWKKAGHGEWGADILRRPECDEDELTIEGWKRAYEMAGLIVPQEWVEDLDRLRTAGRAETERARRLARDIARRLNLFMSTAFLADLEDTPKPRDQSQSGSVEWKASLIRDIMAPAPQQLFLWRDAGEVGRPIRVSIDLSIEGVLNGEATHGLQAGEGRLLRTIAAKLGFAERHWPSWMHKGVLA